MRFFSVPTLIIAVLFSAIAVIPFLPAAHRKSNQFALETKLSSTLPGNVQVYYDDGQGFRETASTRISLAKSTSPLVYRLNIPAGKYKQFRFDVVDNAAIVTIESVNLVDKQGHVVREVPLTDIQALNQIQSRNVRDGRLEIVPTADASDPQLLIKFEPQLKLRIPWALPSILYGHRLCLEYVS